MIKYPVILYPAEEGGFVAEIISLPGCLAQGETYQECLEELETVCQLWIEDYLTRKESLPKFNDVLDKLLEFNNLEFA